MKRRTGTILGLALAALLLLGGCAGFSIGGNTNQYFNPAQQKYYQGTQGVEARFDQLPPTLYYYGNAPGSSANDIPIDVEVSNLGGSYSRGAVFISGYDPNLIKIDEIPIANSYPGACTLRLGDYSLNQFGMTMQCGQNFAWSGNEDNWLQSIMVRGQTWFSSDNPLSKMIFNYQKTNTGGQVSFTLDDKTISFDQREHGLLLIALLAGLSFQQYLGQEFLLAGNTYEYPGGEIANIQYHAHLDQWPQGADQIPQHFLLTTCYMYTTFAAPMVCIDPQPYSENRKVCTPQTATWSGGEGAPVAITSVTQENTPRTAVFHVTVSNVGGGTVFDPGSLEKCSPYYPGGAQSSDQNALWIGEVRIGQQMLTCTPSTYIRLQNGQASFTCTYPIQFADVGSAYQTPLVIELWYGYSKTYDTIVPVKRVT